MPPVFLTMLGPGPESSSSATLFSWGNSIYPPLTFIWFQFNKSLLRASCALCARNTELIKTVFLFKGLGSVRRQIYKYLLIFPMS